MSKKTREEIRSYLYKHKDEYIRGFQSIDEGVRQFDCLDVLIDDGYVEFEDLKDYGFEPKECDGKDDDAIKRSSLRDLLIDVGVNNKSGFGIKILGEMVDAVESFYKKDNDCDGKIDKVTAPTGRESCVCGATTFYVKGEGECIGCVHNPWWDYKQKKQVEKEPDYSCDTIVGEFGECHLGTSYNEGCVLYRCTECGKEKRYSFEGD